MGTMQAKQALKGAYCEPSLNTVNLDTLDFKGFFTKLLPGTAFAEAAKTIMKPQPSARGRLLDKSEVGEPSPVADGGTGASKAVPAKKAM